MFLYFSFCHAGAVRAAADKGSLRLVLGGTSCGYFEAKM